MSDMSLRPRSQRVSARATRLAAARSNQERSTEVYPGLNDITDTFEAFPTEVGRYFTLYKEIDAKYVTALPVLLEKAARFKKLVDPAKRLALMGEMAALLVEILPCLEEKMHVASIAADKTASFMGKINDDFEFIQRHEIPEIIRLGPHNHPAIIHDAKIPDNKSAQTQRSESRREALAAKKAAHDPNDDENSPAPTTSGRGKGRPRADREGTSAAATPTTATGGSPAISSTVPIAPATTKKRKTNSGNATGSAGSNGHSNASHGSSVSNALHQPLPPPPPQQQQHLQNQQLQQQQFQHLHQNAQQYNQHTQQQSQHQHHQHQQLFRNNASNGPTAHSQLLGTFSAQVSANVQEEPASRPDTPSSGGPKRARTSTKKKQEQEQQQAAQEQEEGLYRDEEGLLRNSMGEMVYCYCNQVSYGEMVGCDDNDCKREWFHLPCTGLTTLPRGKWYCDECKQKRGKK